MFFKTQQPSLESIQAQLTQLKSTLDLQKDIATLRAELTLQLSYFKWAAWTAGVILAVVGFFGVKAWNDLTGTVQRAHEKQLAEMQDRYSNLSRGFSLVDSGRTGAAIPYLIPLYEANRYDDPVVRALLFALSDLNDCEEGLRRVKEIRQDEVRFLRFKDPQIFNFTGIILRDCSVSDRTAIEEARKLFDLSLNRLSADDPERRFPLFGLFTYYLAKGDLQTAEKYLQNASTITEDYPPPVETLLKESWAKKILQNHEPNADKLKPLLDGVRKSSQQKFK